MRALWENFKQALLSLKANLLRSLLTTLGIVIGITTIIAIISVIEGLNESFSNSISAIGQGVLYVQKWDWGSNDWEAIRGRRDITMREARILEDQLRTAQNTAITARTSRDIRYKTHKIEMVQCYGTGPSWAPIRNIEVVRGRFISETEVEAARNVVVLGADIADQLFQGEDPIDKRLYLGGRSFRVIGVMGKTGSTLGFNLDTIVVIPLGTFFKSFGAHRSLTILVQAPDPADVSATEEEVLGVMRRARRLRFGEENDFSINQMDILRELYEKLTGGLYTAMFAVAFISLLVGGIGIMNIMMVSVTERTREIGIRKALGAKRRSILQQFLIEAIVLSALGGVVGIALGFGLAMLVAAVSPVPAAVQVWSVILGLLFSSLVGIFFGIYPAYKASRLKPIEALSYE
ncbi:MAG: ABC transporter permease [Candidatus Alcyoniella australis]|nr:ABC transporter permease [Candidatus Alcyoniella australis]